MFLGHILLVGVGGSGKKSLTSLASVLASCKMQTIEIKKKYGNKELKEDLFRIMQIVGIENKRVTLLFADNHIIHVNLFF